MCHPNAESYRDLTPKQIYKKHENEKKRQSGEGVMEIEQGTFSLLVFTTTSGMADEWVNKQIYKKHENEKKRQYAERVMEIEQGTFTPIVFTTKGG